MSYSDDAVKAKLNSLNETQDSIVTVAQWIMFHRRHADRTAALWLSRLQEANMSKRLNLIYLANEVVQQSRARSKTDFLLAFEPLIADATATAYKGTTQEVQGKLRRVVEVWRQRSIFDPRIQEQTEQRIDEIDKQKNGKSLGGGGGRLGGSLFGGGGGGVASELEAVHKNQVALNKAEAGTKPAINTANTEYARMTDPSTPVSSAPVRAHRLGGLVKNLKNAQAAVEASIQARRELLAGLQKLLDSNRAKLADEEAISAELGTKIGEMEVTQREVEDSIMRGQDDPAADLNGSAWNAPDPARPETEGFTPPPPETESFTPPPQHEEVGALSYQLAGESSTDHGYANTTGAEPFHEEPPNFNEPPPAYVPPPALPEQSPAAQAEDILKTLISAGNQVRQASGEIPSTSTGGNPGDPRLKRRKMNHQASNNLDDEIFGAGNVGGVDEAQISAMLSQ